MADTTLTDKGSGAQTRQERSVEGKNIGGVLLFLLFGTLFGFLLSRAGATTYDFYAKLFLFQDLQLLWVIAVAAGVGFIGTTVFKLVKAKTIVTRKPLNFKGKPYTKTLIPGSLLFGIGWGLAGACPGTALAMLGEGKLGSIATIAGFILGTWLYGLAQKKAFSKAADSPGSSQSQGK